MKIHKEMNLHPFSLSFKGPLEKEYLNDYFETSIALLRLSFILGILYYSAFAILDILIMPEQKLKIFVIRFLFVCPLVLIIFFLSYLKNFKRWWQFASMLATFIAGLGIIMMLPVGNEVGQITYYAGVSLVLVYCYMLIRLRFIWASLTGWSLVICYLFAANLLTDIPGDFLTANTFFLVSVNILGMFGGYALEYYTRREFYLRRLLNEEKEKVSLINRQLELRVQQRTKELNENIMKLQMENQKRIKAEANLQHSLAEKETLLRELYHRTKNNMQVICSMISLMSEGIDNEFVKQTFKNLSNRIKSMALVHQKLYQAENLSQVNLKEYIEDLLDILVKSLNIDIKRIDLKLELQDVFILIDMAIPCGLVLNELITNALKHAFPGNSRGEISIRLFRDKNGFINLFVEDNGIGIPDGVDLRNSPSMGMQNIFTLVEYQLRGEISYSVNNGLKWHIILKEDLYKKRI